MPRLKWILAGALALPAAEIVIFALIAARIGLAATLALTLATSAVGVCVLRAGGAARSGERGDKSTGGIIAIATANPGKVLAGLLLALPGFLTDVAGALLLIPIIRRWVAGAILSGAAFRRDRASDVVDLGPGEWHRLREDAPRRDRAETMDRG
jgi:UPF0716 protein FxsA